MKILLTSIFSLILSGLLAQNNESNVSTVKYYLDKNEISAIKKIIPEKDSSIIFESKKIGFAVGIRGDILLNKQEFFDKYINTNSNQSDEFECALITLTENEKKESGGFDFIIMAPAKIFTLEDRQELIIRLKTSN